MREPPRSKSKDFLTGAAVGALAGLIIKDLDLTMVVSYWAQRSPLVAVAALVGAVSWLTSLRKLLAPVVAALGVLWLAVAFTPLTHWMAKDLPRRDPLRLSPNGRHDDLLRSTPRNSAVVNKRLAYKNARYHAPKKSNLSRRTVTTSGSASASAMPNPASPPPEAAGACQAIGISPNNIVYFRYFESARLAYFERVGFLDEMKRSGVGPILATTQCRFRKPLTYPDRIRIGATVNDLQEDRFTMLYCIESVALGTIAADGEGLIVAFDYNENRKTALPDSVRRAILELEEG